MISYGESFAQEMLQKVGIDSKGDIAFSEARRADITTPAKQKHNNNITANLVKKKRKKDLHPLEDVCVERLEVTEWIIVEDV